MLLFRDYQHRNNKLRLLYNFFQNVDGNRSNFDNFALHISTNLNTNSLLLDWLKQIPILKTKICLTLDEYASFYQEIDPTKSKGTGVALYIHNAECTDCNCGKFLIPSLRQFRVTFCEG